MQAELLATGDEIRTGSLVDSNSAWIAERLIANGIDVRRHHCCGDDLVELVGVLREISGRSDLCVVTGGLGPTSDDRSAAAAAEAAGVPLLLDSDALEVVERFFRKAGRPLTASNRKQAELPQGSDCLDNPVGTAPGFSLMIGACRCFFLPGVPYEMKRMLADQVLPRLQELRGDDDQVYLSRTLTTFGLPESQVGELVAPVEAHFSDLLLGLRAKFPVIQVKLYGSGSDRGAVETQLESGVSWVAEQLGDHLISRDGESLEAVVGRLLHERGTTIAVAESCTGGLLAHRLTNVAGSSDYFLFSAVTYANSAKKAVLKVAADTLTEHGAVSDATAKAMAEGVRRRAGADYGLATTGIAGPTGGSAEKPVGTVWIGLATPHDTRAIRRFFPFGRRLMNKQMFAMAALEALRRELMGIQGAN
ncbi:MAG: competence/damage-inducible protein A [Desulfosarcinaceae bacterium]|nr:competence/damage-inducible protein A [Desulfosarcinaceae bacterium]